MARLGGAAQSLDLGERRAGCGETEAFFAARLLAILAADPTPFRCSFCKRTPMSSIGAKLLADLRSVQRPGAFCVGGKREIFMPAIDVDGVGRIAFPIQPAQAERLVGVAATAPYGRGEETLVDRDVRRTWQVDSASGPNRRAPLGEDPWRSGRPGGARTWSRRSGLGRVLQASRLRRGQLLPRPPRHGKSPGHVRDHGARAALGSCRRRTGGEARRPGGDFRPATGRTLGNRLRRLLRRLRARGAAGDVGLSHRASSTICASPTEAARKRPTIATSRRGRRRRCGPGRTPRTSRSS